MKYKTSDVIRKALQLSDLTNSDFLSWDEKISSVNDAYTMLYQKLVDIGDASFVKDFVASYGETILPEDFWQLKSVNLVNNKMVTPVKRRADSESYATLSYEIRFDRLYINGTPNSTGSIVVSYWAKPKTLTYKPNPVKLEPVIPEGATIIGVHDSSFFYTLENVLYQYNCKTDELSNTDTLEYPIDVFIPGNEEAYFHYDVPGSSGYRKTLRYDDMSISSIDTGLYPFITESGVLGIIRDTPGEDSYLAGYIGNQRVFDWEYVNEPENPVIITCDDNFTDFWAVGTYEGSPNYLYHNGEVVEANGDMVHANTAYYVNGVCWYCFVNNGGSLKNEIGYLDADENISILASDNRVIGINKIDCNTGYGYTVANKDGTFTCFPWVEDTVLDFPNSMYFQIMSYMLAVQFKIKQGADSTGLQTLLSSMEQTFYDTLTQDANQPVRIKNVY